MAAPIKSCNQATARARRALEASTTMGGYANPDGVPARKALIAAIKTVEEQNRVGDEAIASAKAVLAGMDRIGLGLERPIEPGVNAATRALVSWKRTLPNGEKIDYAAVGFQKNNVVRWAVTGQVRGNLTWEQVITDLMRPSDWPSVTIHSQAPGIRRDTGQVMAQGGWVAPSQAFDDGRDYGSSNY